MWSIYNAVAEHPCDNYKRIKIDLNVSKLIKLGIFVKFLQELKQTFSYTVAQKKM